MVSYVALSTTTNKCVHVFELILRMKTISWTWSLSANVWHAECVIEKLWFAFLCRAGPRCCKTSDWCEKHEVSVDSDWGDQVSVAVACWRRRGEWGPTFDLPTHNCQDASKKMMEDNNWVVFDWHFSTLFTKEEGMNRRGRMDRRGNEAFCTKMHLFWNEFLESTQCSKWTGSRRIPDQTFSSLDLSGLGCPSGLVNVFISTELKVVKCSVQCWLCVWSARLSWRERCSAARRGWGSCPARRQRSRTATSATRHCPGNSLRELCWACWGRSTAGAPESRVRIPSSRRRTWCLHLPSCSMLCCTCQRKVGGSWKAWTEKEDNVNKRSSAQGNCKCEVPGVFALSIQLPPIGPYRMGQDRMGQDRMGRDKGDILPEMPYICLYTLMDHVDQLSQPSTNSHQLAHTGWDGMGWDGTGQDKGDILPEMPYICLYTLMDHVDQLSQASTNSHQLTPSGEGGDIQDMGQRGTSSPSWHIYWKIFLELPPSAVP